MSELTHLDDQGAAHMVDVSEKQVTRRMARARAVVEMAPGTADAIRNAALAKGDVVAAARLAGIQAAKRTDSLIPLCHSLPLEAVSIKIVVGTDEVVIETEARCEGKTGVEMEALVAASVSALTIYDMAKAIDRGMRIVSVELLEKRGGRSGHWIRAEPEPDR